MGPTVQTKSEKRRAERYDYPAGIEYVLGSDGSEEAFRGVTINISKSGLSLYAFSPLVVGQEIVIRSALPVADRRAVILWTKQEDDSMYKIGLKFTNGIGIPDKKKSRA
jgi:hypothetical protein